MSRPFLPVVRLLAVLLLAGLTGCAASEPIVAPADDAPPPPTETAPAEPVADDEPAEDAEPPSEAPEDWYHLAADADAFPGAGVQQAYATVVAGREPQQEVVVAVIDSGVDIEHDDLDDNLWTNEDEIPGNGIDDDANGYVDDVHGWNFIGGADGENVSYDTFEVTRELARLAPKYADADPDALSEEERDEYEYYLTIREEYDATVAQYQQNLFNISQAEQAVRMASQVLTEHFGSSQYTVEQIAGIETQDPQLGQARDIMLYLDSVGVDAELIERQKASIEGRLEYGFNLDFDPREIVGDDYDDPTERGYGNPDVTGPDAFHGTHVAGIIAAERGNGLGLDGIAPSARIMAIRAVPYGDERDKDVANAIRYAVDNGADIINMSFGKGFSPYKDVVDEAVRYAAEQGVLLVHGAGNDAEDNDVVSNFPTRYLTDGTDTATWIEVGASSWQGDEALVAGFSNYGQQGVDLFAPGVSIYSTVPDQGFDRADGTSMAAPVVAGVAALVMAYYPELSAAEVRQILLDSATPFAGQLVVRPGTEGETVDFAVLSRTGGVVNAAAALRLAAERAGQ